MEMTKEKSALDQWKMTGIMPYHTENYIPFHADYEYLRWVQPILDTPFKANRVPGEGNHELFGTPQMEFDLSLGFPLLTTKNVHFESIKVETLWYLRGDTNIKYLRENRVTIWDEWVLEKNGFTFADGEVGPLYGKQWTNWNGPNGTTINQIQNLVNEIKRAPLSKGMWVSSWNPAEISFDFVKLRPCHGTFQCSVSTDGFLNMKMTQRSADWFLGIPFNIGSYAMLLHMLAQATGYTVGRLIITPGSAHIYWNHVEQMKLQLTREPMPLCKIELNPDITDIFKFGLDDIKLVDYVSHARIKGDVTI
jgi:thymidylate synthase